MSMLASSSNDLKFYQCPEGTLHQSYLPENHKDGPIKSICWGKGGAWMVLVPHSGPAEIISVRENTKLLHIVESIYHPTCAAFQNNTKKNIVFGTSNGQVLLYDVKSRTVQKRFPRANSQVFSITSNANDSHFATGCTNGDVLLYNSVTSNISNRYKVPKSKTVTVVNFHRNVRSLLGAGSEEGMVATWDINTNAVRYTTRAHCALVTDMIFSPIRSDLLVTCGLDRKFSFYDLLSKKSTLQVETDSSITSFDFSYCGTYLATGCQNGSIVLYDTRNLAIPVLKFLGHAGKKVCHLVFQNQAKLSNNGNSKADSLLEEMLRNDQQEHSSKEATDSFEILSSGKVNSQTTIRTSTILSQAVEDSFIVMMGLNSNTSLYSSLEQKNPNSPLPTELKNMVRLQGFLQQASVAFPEGLAGESRTPAVGIKQPSSTPKYEYFIPELPKISPVVAVNDAASFKQSGLPSRFELHSQAFSRMVSDAVKEGFGNYKKEIPTASPIGATIASRFGLHSQDFSGMVRDAVKEGFENYKKETPTASSIDDTTAKVPLNARHCNLSMEDLKTMVRGSVKEGMKDFKEEIRMEFFGTNMDIRRGFLDLQMYFVEKFVDFKMRPRTTSK